MKDLVEIISDAEDLKVNIWALMEQKNLDHRGLKSAMNEVLDLLEEVELGEEE